MTQSATPEHRRLTEEESRAANWKRWGPYLSERQWGTVREDYSPDGNAWSYFSHDDARSRAYRWGEDGLLGISDRHARLCFALALWNERDPILKERIFGLTNPEGTHGEDAKEVWHYLDSTPTHSYLRALYKYPQAAFPYSQLLEENARRGKMDREFELEDTGVFAESRYFDVIAEYAKASPDDILIRLTLANRGPDSARLHLLPTLWFRNTWSWNHSTESARPQIRRTPHDPRSVIASHPALGDFRLATSTDAPWLFTENETNHERIFKTPNHSPYLKDAFHEAIIHGKVDALNPHGVGTKVAPHLILDIPPGGQRVIQLRLAPLKEWPEKPFENFDQIFATRRAEADAFFQTKYPPGLSSERQNVLRQTYAGLLWSKQFYHYVVKDWLAGDPKSPRPPSPNPIRNQDWKHLHNDDVISVPDKWEYPWYASWDLAFHMIPMARVDPHFAKEQLLLFLREWFMHPSGAIPAYEWNLHDVNPPVHAYACLRVYQIDAESGTPDVLFLERAFQKLLINFTWWVNRKDPQGNHLFAGGFLGLDNIGLFDRSKPLPTGQSLAQADGTAWMAFYCSTMLGIALELAKEKPQYDDIASKFLEHTAQILTAMNSIGNGGLWDELDGFYYDQLLIEGHDAIPLKVRSMVGLLPLFGVEIIDQKDIERLPNFQKRLKWFVKNRPDLAKNISYVKKRTATSVSVRRMLAIPKLKRLVRILPRVFDEKEFLSPFGIRSLSQVYGHAPYHLPIGGVDYSISYEPAESQGAMFGGNSNWRGPVWLPMNYLLIEALRRYHDFYGDSFQLEFPTRSGVLMNLSQIADQLTHRVSLLFLPDQTGARPCFADHPHYANDPHWRDHVLFHEHFCGETGRGLGASHQTGWTALIADLLSKPDN